MTTLVRDAKALADKIASVVGATPQGLTAVDIRRPSHPTSTVAAKMDRAQALVPLHKAMVMATKTVADALFLAQSESWDGASMHYSVLKRLAKRDGTIAKALEPVAQFFAARSAAVTAEQKAKRGGARKGSKKAQPSPIPSQDANAPAQAQAEAPSPGEPAPSLPATPPPAESTNGAAH